MSIMPRQLRSATPRMAAAGPLLCALLALAGCASPNGSVAGYTSSELYDQSIRTVALPIFQNRSFYRGMEFALTEALQKEIEHRTPYKVTRPGGADTILSGSIVSVDQRLLSRGLGAGLAQEVQVVVALSFEWKDLRSGEIIRRRSRLEGSGEFIPSRGVGEPVEVARHEAVDELSREIVSLMRGDW